MYFAHLQQKGATNQTFFNWPLNRQLGVLVSLGDIVLCLHGHVKAEDGLQGLPCLVTYWTNWLPAPEPSLNNGH